MSKLVGYRRFTSKKNGKDYCVAEIETLSILVKLHPVLWLVAKLNRLFMPEEQYDS